MTQSRRIKTKYLFPNLNVGTVFTYESVQLKIVDCVNDGTKKRRFCLERKLDFDNIINQGIAVPADIETYPQYNPIVADCIEGEKEKLLDEVDEILNRLRNDEKSVFTWSEVREWVKSKRNAGAKN